MKWFSHESNASNDSKIKKLLLAYGAEGYAVYFHCLELIASDINENHINFELEHDAEIIADNLKIKGTNTHSGRERVEEIMRKIISLNLFQEDSGRIYCFQLARRLSSVQIKNPRLKEIQLLIEQRLEEFSKKFSESDRKFLLPTLPTNTTNQQDESFQGSSLKSEKHKYGPEKNVLLTDSDVSKLKSELGDEYDFWITEFSESVAMHGYKYKNHRLAIINWKKKRDLERGIKSNSHLPSNDVFINKNVMDLSGLAHPTGDDNE